jgi:hemerythrin
MTIRLIDPADPAYRLGHAQMDMTHLEFMDLVNRLGLAGKPAFMMLFGDLLRHTQSHFDAEDRLMVESGFPALREHRDEHTRVIGELHRFASMLEKGSITMARAWVCERLPDWFNLHARTMDSALVAHLKLKNMAPPD